MQPRKPGQTHKGWKKSARKKHEPALIQEAPKLVISRWLKQCSAGQWTPFEAACAIEAELEKAGYEIVSR